MKTFFSRIKLLLISLLFVCTPALVCGHHLWVDALNDGYVVRRGFLPDDVHRYNPAFVTEVRMIGSSFRELPVQRTDGPHEVMLKTVGLPELVIVICEWGNRVNTPEGKKFMSRNEALGKGFHVESSFTSTQFSKTYFPPYDRWTRSVGLPLEIVPLEEFDNHTHTKRLPVKIVFQNKPLPDSLVRLRPGDISVRTNDEGMAYVPLGETGPQTIIAFHTVPENDHSDIDYRQFMSFIKFDLPAK